MAKVPTADDVARAMDALRRIVRALDSTNARAEGDLRVTSAQLFVLRQIDASPRLSLSELARRTCTAQSTVSEVVARLITQELVVRAVAAADARRSELTLSAKGRAIAARASATVQEQLVAGFECMSAGQQQTLADGLESWVERAGLGEVAPTFFFEAN